MTSIGGRPPREHRYFEDYVAGDIYDCSSVAVTEADMVDFARRYDPQDMHTDPVAAMNSRFGGLVASGWHTTVLAMRQYVDHYLSSVASLASPGVDELRWPNPVRPGDVLRVQAIVLESIHSRTKADRGVVRARLEAQNQHGQPVLSALMTSILGKRHAAASS